jgi:hypothetical protein
MDIDFTDDEPQTAMLLTEQEWTDLSEMVTYFRNCTAEWDNVEFDRPNSEWAVAVGRKRALALRIIEACQP